jgi:hypothetical protein
MHVSSSSPCAGGVTVVSTDLDLLLLLLLLVVMVVLSAATATGSPQLAPLTPLAGAAPLTVAIRAAAMLGPAAAAGAARLLPLLLLLVVAADTQCQKKRVQGSVMLVLRQQGAGSTLGNVNEAGSGRQGLAAAVASQTLAGKKLWITRANLVRGLVQQEQQQQR